MRSPHAAVAALGLAVALLAATGCAYEDAPEDGSLEIPVIQPGPDGALYRLRAFLLITRPDGSAFGLETGDEPSLTLNLNPGLHAIELLDGWALDRSTDGGATYQQVPAILGSVNPTTIRLVPNRNVSVGFQFFVREPTGTLTISLGVTPRARQLSGGFRIANATGAYTAYINRRIDTQIYFDQPDQSLVIDNDDSRARVYTSFLNALEIYNDPFGFLTTAAEGFAGGTLEFTLRINPDGTHAFEGSYIGATGATLTFAPSTYAELPVGSDGFPADEFFYTHGSPVELATDDGTVSGVLTSIRHFP